ncbi:MAG: lamin tail domain-containing protein [Patescibacteria group bacterium]|nr:lamin tail domain-containing protein [Patescibacteria group bacterium]
MLKYLSLFVLLIPLSTYGLVISEVQIEGDSPSECYIKIYNPLSEIIDISSYRLRKKTSTGKDYSLRVFPAKSYIEEGSFFIWASSQNQSFPEIVEADTSSKQTISSDNGIALFNNNDILIDSVCWGSSKNSYCAKGSLENPQKKQVIKRKDNVGDFYLYPPPLSLSDIKEVKIEKQEKQKTHPFIFGFFLSLFLAILVLYIKIIITK